MDGHHIIHFCGPITPVSTNQFLSIVLQAIQKNPKKITVFFSSEGGDLNSGFTMYNFLRTLPVPLCICNFGTVESIAVAMFLAADERLALANSRFLIHGLHWSFNAGAIVHQKLTEYSDSLTYDVNRYIQIFNDRTKLAQSPIDISKHLNGSALILGPSAAMYAGIISGTMSAEGAIPCDAAHWWVSAF